MATKNLEICDKCGHVQEKYEKDVRKMFTIGAVWESGAQSSISTGSYSHSPRQESKSCNLCFDCMKEIGLIVDEKPSEPPKEETPVETLLRILSEVARAEAHEVLEYHESREHRG